MVKQVPKMFLGLAALATVLSGCGLEGIVPSVAESNTERPPASHYQDDYTREGSRISDELGDMLMDYLDHNLHTEAEVTAGGAAVKKAYLVNAEAALGAAGVSEGAIEEILKVLGRYADVTVDGSVELAIYTKPLYDKSQDAHNLSPGDAIGMLGDVRDMITKQVNPLIERIGEVETDLNRVHETYRKELPSSDYLYALMGDADRSYDFAEAFDFNF